MKSRILQSSQWISCIAIGFAAVFISSTALSVPVGFYDLGVTSKDQNYLFPFCGTYSLSKTTSLDSCLLNSDIYVLPTAQTPLYKLTVIFQNFVDDHYETVQFAESDGFGLFIENHVTGDYDLSKKFDRSKLDKVHISLFNLKTPKVIGGLLKADYEADVPANACWQGFVISGQDLALICGNATEVFVHRIKAQGLAGILVTKTKIMDAAAAKVKSGYDAIPQFQIDRNSNQLVQTKSAEDLGGGIWVMPPGTFDLKTDKYTPK